MSNLQSINDPRKRKQIPTPSRWWKTTCYYFAWSKKRRGYQHPTDEQQTEWFWNHSQFEESRLGNLDAWNHERSWKVILASQCTSAYTMARDCGRDTLVALTSPYARWITSECCQTLRWRLTRMKYCRCHCFNDWNPISFNCNAVPRRWQMLVLLPANNSEGCTTVLMMLQWCSHD